MTKDQELAEIKLHPAVIVMGCLIASLYARNVLTLNLGSKTDLVCQLVGAGMVVVGVFVLVLAYGSFARARTTINPREHTTAMVTTGIYAYSRNPIYVGWFLLIAGMGIKHASLAVIFIAALMIVLLLKAVILKEEQYLENRFGEAYLSYKRKVGRWV